MTYIYYKISTMEQYELLRIIEAKFEELDDIFHNIDCNDRDEEQELLFEAYSKIGLRDISILKNLLYEIIQNEPFQFLEEHKNHFIIDEYHEIILNYVWDIDFGIPNMNNHFSLTSEEIYYEKLKNGLNPVQLNTIQNVVNDEYESGIVCIATGGGKSIISLKLINIFNNTLITKPRSILIFTERKNILLDLFYTPQKENNKYIYVKNETYWNVWRRLGIIDMDEFNLINLVSNKDKNWSELKMTDKTNLIIINRVYLTLNGEYKKIIGELSPQLVIYDECQGITAKTSFEFLEYAKKVWNSKII